MLRKQTKMKRSLYGIQYLHSSIHWTDGRAKKESALLSPTEDRQRFKFDIQNKPNSNRFLNAKFFNFLEWPVSLDCGNGEGLHCNKQVKAR